MNTEEHDATAQDHAEELPNDELDSDAYTDASLDEEAMDDFDQDYNEDETSLGDDEFSLLDEEGQTAPAKKNLVALLKENWLFVSIGVAVTLIAIYMIYSVLSPSTPSAPPPAISTQQQTATMPNTPAAPAPPPNIVMTEAQMQALMQSFQQMVQQNSASIGQNIQSVITTLQENNKDAQAIAALETQFQTLNQQIGKYNQNLANLNNRLNTLQGQLSILLAKETASEEQLTLRAVVPGRAWLVDGKGRTISVVEGSQLGTFGIVTDIDATRGTVTTSSGYTFK